MDRKKVKPRTAAVTADVPEGIEAHCLNCKRCGQLMQWGQNPIIAHCTMSGERQVARRTRCKYWVYDKESDNKPITQMRK